MEDCMKLYKTLLLPIIAIGLVTILSACAGRKPANTQAIITPQSNALGGDRDSQGCIGSAGYSWCAIERQCLRPFEVAVARGFQNTPQAFMAYCDGSLTTVRSNTPMPQAPVQPAYSSPVAPPTPVPVQTTPRTTPTRNQGAIGGKVDAYGCMPSAGYTWCASQNECVRPAELAKANGLPNNKRTFNAYCNAKPATKPTKKPASTQPLNQQQSMSNQGYAPDHSDAVQTYTTPTPTAVNSRPFKADAHGCTANTGPWCESEQQCVSSKDLAAARGIPNNKTAYKKWCATNRAALAPAGDYIMDEFQLNSSKGGSSMVGNDMQTARAANNTQAIDESAFANACNEEAGYAWCAREQQCLRTEVLAKSRRIANTRQAFNKYCGR